MSALNKMENPHLISLSMKSKSVPSLLLSSESNKKNEDSLNVHKKLKIIDDEINNKTSELLKIQNKLTQIKKKQFLIEKEKYELNEHSLPYSKKQEILENNKIIRKLNLQNISINKKINKISEKADKIEYELLYGEKSELHSYIKEKLKEYLNQKDVLKLKIDENNYEIQKINEKGNKNKIKFNKKLFLDNLDDREHKLINLKKYYLSDSNIKINLNLNNADKNYHKSLYEEEKNKKIKDQKIREEKYKEMREKEIKTVQNRKNVHFNLDKEIKSRNWINNLSNKKNYFSWDIKEKQRIQDEEKLIQLSNQKRNLLYQPLSSEELTNFSNKVKHEKIKTQINLKIKKKLLEELWKERKNLLPKYQSKFMKTNIQNDKNAKIDMLLKKEKIKGHVFEKLNFSSEVCKKFRPKLIDEKIKKERIKKIMELEGINKKREIQELDNKLKHKLIQIVNSQPKNFRKKNIFKMSKSVAEQQILKLQYFKNVELTEIKLKENENNKDIIYSNNDKKNNSNNNNNQKKKTYDQLVKDIQTKIKILNELLE